MTAYTLSLNVCFFFYNFDGNQCSKEMILNEMNYDFSMCCHLIMLYFNRYDRIPNI